MKRTSLAKNQNITNKSSKEISRKSKPYQPLASILRPNSIDQIIGQDHLISNNGILSRIVNSKEVPSLILWGNPGCGKTSIAKIIAKIDNYHCEVISAINSNVSDLRKIFDQAIKKRTEDKINTILIIDEIHRFNKSQMVK